MVKPIVVKDNLLIVNGEVINDLAVIVDSTVGLVKYGKQEFVKDYFNKSIELYTVTGFKSKVEDLKYIEFNKTTLTIEEIATFINYMILVSANEDNINRLCCMEESELKERLRVLKTVGF